MGENDFNLILGNLYVEDWHGISIREVRGGVQNTKSFPFTINSPQQSIRLKIGGVVDLEYRFFNAILHYTKKKVQIVGILRVYGLGAICLFKKYVDGLVLLIPPGEYYIVINPPKDRLSFWFK